MIRGHKYIYGSCDKVLVYLGHNWSGNRYWHQFALGDDELKKVWCEVLDSDLVLMKEVGL